MGSFTAVFYCENSVIICLLLLNVVALALAYYCISLFLGIFGTVTGRMGSYYHTQHSSFSAPPPHSAICSLQSSRNPGLFMRKYVADIPAPRSFITDCHAEKNLSDICAVIRHHILDQVATTGRRPLDPVRQSASLSNRANSAPSYAVRGTK